MMKESSCVSYLFMNFSLDLMIRKPDVSTYNYFWVYLVEISLRWNCSLITILFYLLTSWKKIIECTWYVGKNWAQSILIINLDKAHSIVSSTIRQRSRPVFLYYVQYTLIYLANVSLQKIFFKIFVLVINMNKNN